MREPMSDNWKLIREGLFHLYKANDNSYFCTAYVERPTHPMLLVRSCFVRDLNHLTGPLSKYRWCPQFGQDNRDGWRIYLRFGGHFCKDILDRGEVLDEYCPDWKEQLTQMCLDFRQEKIYKVTMDPEYFFIDEDKNLKTFGFFNCFTYGEQPVGMEIMMPTFSPDASQIVRSNTEHGRFDFKYLEEYVYKNSAWLGSLLEEIYGKMYAVNMQETQV
jgi:hypothetical protein